MALAKGVVPLLGEGAVAGCHVVIAGHVLPMP